MVDFSLTEADVRLMAIAERENALARTIARQVDREVEDQPKDNSDHPLFAAFESPQKALFSEKEPISGEHITECLMAMVSGEEIFARGNIDSFGTWLVNAYGTPAQKAAYGDKALVIGITEPGAGADPASITSSARYDPATDEYILDGEKTFISHINREDGVVVLVKGEPDESGKRPFHNFVILKGAPGFTVLPPMKKLGIRFHDLGGLVMQGLRVPALAKLDANFGSVQTKLTNTRPWVAAFGLGICRALLDFTHAKLAEAGVEVDYAKGRANRSFAEDKLIRLEALWEATWGVIIRAKWLEQQIGAEALGRRSEASIAKTMGGKATRQITQGCMEILGAEGVSEEHLAEKWFRDARITDIYEGPGEVHRLAVARKLLGYRKGELD